MEHVRPDEILPLLRKLHKAIRPRGRLVQHFFSLNTGPLPPSMIAAQLFFPGSTLATHAHHLEAAREAGFTLPHDPLHDYRPPLSAGGRVPPRPRLAARLPPDAQGVVRPTGREPGASAGARGARDLQQVSGVL